MINLCTGHIIRPVITFWTEVALPGILNPSMSSQLSWKKEVDVQEERKKLFLIVTYYVECWSNLLITCPATAILGRVIRVTKLI